MSTRDGLPAPSPQDHLEKAHHNENWAEFLFRMKPGGELEPAFDWSATMAYYAAIQFFLYFIRKETPEITWGLKSDRISTLADFLSKFDYQGSKHSAYIEIISSNYHTAAGSWRLLFNTAHSARYNTQKVSQKKAELSLNKLKVVKERFCSVN